MSHRVRRLLIPLALLASPAIAQDHTGMIHHPVEQPRAAGQSAFGAVQEIVALLLEDPATDWSEVDIEALRQHLIDMDNVTLRADVTMSEIDDGAVFEVRSADPAVAASIQAMVMAHADTMAGAGGIALIAERLPDGARLEARGATGDGAKIRALGFIGVMTIGAHHQAHHLALAKGSDPHGH